MKPSIQFRVILSTLRLFKFKKKVERKVVNYSVKAPKRFVPYWFKWLFKSNIQEVHFKTIATFELKNQKRNQHIIFFHGGAYVFNMSAGHWNLAMKIIKKSRCRMTIIDYPLAPEHDYKDTFRMINNAYAMLIEDYPNDDFILMGDSAGGGLALAFAQNMSAVGYTTMPSKIVLLSPWLDLSLSNPDIKNFEGSDHILSVNMLKTAATKYSGGDDMNNPLLSPINGTFYDLPETIVFYGTEEILYPDCMKLKKKKYDNFVFKEYKNMQHDWGLFPIPETHMLVEDICEFL